MLGPECMFDKFHSTLNFKSKVFENKIECQLTYTFYSQMLPQIWVTQYIRKFNVLNNQNTILICSIFF